MTAETETMDAGMVPASPPAVATGPSLAPVGEGSYAPGVAAGDDARARIQRLLVTGDNRLKQGVAAEKVRESYEQALAVAREAGLEDAVRPLVEVRLADLDARADG